MTVNTSVYLENISWSNVFGKFFLIVQQVDEYSKTEVSFYAVKILQTYPVKYITSRENSSLYGSSTSLFLDFVQHHKVSMYFFFKFGLLIRFLSSIDVLSDFTQGILLILGHTFKHNKQGAMSSDQGLSHQNIQFQLACLVVREQM